MSAKQIMLDRNKTFFMKINAMTFNVMFFRVLHGCFTW